MAILSTNRIPEVRPLPPGATSAPFGDVLIARIGAKADLSQDAQLPRGPERKTAVYRDLLATAQSSQTAAVAKLNELKAQGLVSSFESMYLPNALVVKAAAGKWEAVAQALSGVADIKTVTENHTWSVPTKPAFDAISGATRVSDPQQFNPGADLVGAPEWGVAKINAPAAWAKGYTGQGVTIGIVDTGLDSRHPAIAPHYRGTKADGTQDNNYNWYDPTAGAQSPLDDGEHGTHVAGTSAGGTDGHVTGVAPGAKLIAAKAILGSGYNTTEATLKALQWMLAPTDLAGKHADPTRGADVINNSWGDADHQDTMFQDTWDAMNAAGIIMVSAAGNDGPRGTVSPPGSYLNGISVAASTSGDTIARFSSRGPSNFDPTKTVPNIAAPGVAVTSSVPGGRYATFDGTSMASPHVTGAVALMLSAKPNASFEEIRNALEKTAVDIDAKGVDSAAGYGRIDVNAAIEELLHPTAAVNAAPAAGATPAVTPAA